MRSALLLTICGALILSLAGSTGADLFYSESFGYEPVGESLASFGGWEESQPGAPITIFEPGFTYPGYGGRGNAVIIANCCNGTAQHRGP